MQKKLWKYIFMASRRVCFSYFAKIVQIIGVLNNFFYNFCGSCYNIQFKPYVGM